MKKIYIKGKDYVPVNERLKEFRNSFKDYSLIGRIVGQTPDSVIFEAQVIDDKGVVRANGFARETLGKGGVNKFAMYENAETSAWGRALGNFGIGIDTAVCTADELIVKLGHEQEAPAPAKGRSEFEKDATAQKRAFNKAVKEKAEQAPAAPTPLIDQAKKCLEWLNSLKKEDYEAKANSAKDKAHDIRDACLSSQDAELTELGVKIAGKLKEFVPDIDDKIPY